MEIIVVGLIVVVLALVSVPLYQGFVEEQRKEAVGHIAQAAAATAHAIWRRYERDPTDEELQASLPGTGEYLIRIEGNSVVVEYAEDTDIDTSIDFR